MSVFSERLTGLRKQRNISQSAFAKQIGVSFRTYQDYEYGNYEPKLSTAVRLADFFGVSLDYLAGRSDRP